MDRVKDPADPERCKAAAPDGQCRNRAEPGSDYCHVHRGKSNVEEQDLALYHLTKAQYRRRLAELKGHEEVKSLRDEIALTRILVEERFNSIKNDADLLADLQDALRVLHVRFEPLAGLKSLTGQ